MYVVCRVRPWRCSFRAYYVSLHYGYALIYALTCGQTSGIVQWFLALIGKHPDVQLRAHQELDAVVGRDRWPVAEDEKSLPYVRAIIKEVLRVHAPFWNATPHSSTEDFVYNGMYIPKGSAVILNCFTLHHNEARYPDA